MSQQTPRFPYAGHMFTCRRIIYLYADPFTLNAVAHVQVDEVVMVIDSVSNNFKVLAPNGDVGFVHEMTFGDSFSLLRECGTK